MSQTCEVKRIQQNSAQAMVDQANQALNQARADHLACLGPEDQGNALMDAAKPAMDKVMKEADSIVYMEQFVLKQLQREVDNEQTLSTLSESANETADKLRTEIDELKTDIRTEKRRFLDASPSASTAMGGLYFTRQPDNQVLIVFLSCFGAFLLFSGLLVIMNHIPIAYVQALSTGERFQIVGSIWVVAAIATYLGFFTFT